ncbi:neurogenic locus notch homolog protein 1-like [Stylophora pistillata]|uniref:neurogenic locus notch homolog protein 1-like n=1 Tax=Stylophora pistillata TaxID=50429 RepID=UPI000C03AACC|nr:neurogenic locus notch homolog protein 1-like [Stylophora pistillata]
MGKSRPKCSIAGQCRNLEFSPERAFEGKRLMNHTIRIVEVTVARFCENVCYMEPDCVSINLDKRANGSGGYKCELNNVTHEGHEHHLTDHKDFFYHAAESYCVKNPCKNNARCQSGFTDEGYRCLCMAGFSGPRCSEDTDECVTGLHNCSPNAYCNNTNGSYNCTCKPGFTGNGQECKRVTSCNEIYNNIKGANMSIVVTLFVDSQPVPVLCHMGDFGCGNGGWTPVMKIDGRNITFHYNKRYWSDYNEFNPTGGQTGFDEQETKLPTYWNTSFSKICLGMKIDQQLKFIVIDKHADSLFALIADGKYRSTSLGRDMWISLIGSDASLQQNCNKEGFNADFSWRKGGAKARIGIVGNNRNNCSAYTSRIGFGTGGWPYYSISCGNTASSSRGNGKKGIKAMGYILVH